MPELNLALILGRDDTPAVFHSRGAGRGCKDADASTTTHTRRRFSDPVSDLNATVHDKARLLAETVEMIDRLGLQIMSVEADNARNSRVLVIHEPERCAALGGVEVGRTAGYSHWCANRFGTEIRWVVPVEVAQA